MWLSTKSASIFLIINLLSTDVLCVENVFFKSENILVKSYYGSYDVTNKQPGVPAPSLGEPTLEVWRSPAKANQPYNLAILFPHLKDPYWLTVHQGMFKRATHYGIGIQLWHADGYRNLGKQTLQLQHILDNKEKFDGVIVGAVQFKKPKLEKMYKSLDEAGLPVISVINDSYTPTTKAKALISWNDLGYATGKFLVQHSKGKKSKVLFFVGPRGTGWAPDSQTGFNQALEKYDIEGNIIVLPPVWGDTGDRAQRHLLNFILAQYENVDYLVGNAVAAHAMVSKSIDGESAPIDKYQSRHPNIKVISTYIIPEVYQEIVSGKILAAPADLMMQQGMIAVDMMIKYLNGERPESSNTFPFRAGPIVPLIHFDNIHEWPYEHLFGNRDYKVLPILEPAK